MAVTRKGSNAFFYLGPAGDGKVVCFAIQRGKAAVRFDPIFHLPNSDLPGREGFPTRFAVKKLSDLAGEIIQPNEFIREYVPESPDSVALLRAGNVRDGELDLLDLVFVERSKLEVGRKGFDASYIHEGDILITRTGAKAGETCVVPPLHREFIVSSHTIRVVLNKQTVVPKYLEFFLLSRWGKAQVNRLFTGAAQKQLQLSTVSELQIVLPTNTHQHELVAAMDAARAERRAKLAEADALLASLDGFLLATLGLTPPPKDERRVFATKYRELRGRLDPKTYLYQKHLSTKPFPFRSLGSLTVKEPDYGSGARAVKRTSDDQPKYIRITDFQDDGIPLGHEFLTAEIIEEECALEDGDVLFARSGATAGKTFIYTQDLGAAVFAGYCIRFRFDQNQVLPRFIYYFTKTSAYREWVATIQRPSGQPNINKEEFKSLEVPIPPLSVQRQVVERLNTERQKAETLRAEAEAGWQAAKRWLEEQLLGDTQS